MKIRWLARASRALVDISSYIEGYDPRAANRFVEKVDSVLDLLTHFPALGRVGHIAGTREYILTPSYILIYSVHEDTKTIRILDIRHAVRLWSQGMGA